jgi:uncharacterized protein involved in type VI secretion and phage assembly
MHAFRSMIREVAEQVVGGVRTLVMGVTTSVDQANTAVKATYQPANVESGFMPHMTPLAGNGTGVVAIPPPGVQVVIGHEQGDAQAGLVLGCVWDNNNRPPAAYKPGEVWLISLGSALVKVTNDGKVTLTDKAGSVVTMNGDGTGTMTFSSGLTINADLTVNGKVTATGEGTFNGGHTVSAHTHGGVTAGSSSTATPTG